MVEARASTCAFAPAASKATVVAVVWVDALADAEAGGEAVVAVPPQFARTAARSRRPRVGRTA